jgi:hypothetical protein
MHQPNRLPNPHDSHPVNRGSALTKQRNQKSSAATHTLSKFTTVGVNPDQQQQVRKLPSHAPAPIWLKSLLTAQKVSMIMFCSVFGLSSIVYGYTMHTETTWRTQQEQLRRWENQASQQGVMNENLKQDLAKTAESQASGLVDPKPEMAVFVHGAPPRQPKPLPAKAQASKQIPVSKVPSGY